MGWDTSEQVGEREQIVDTGFFFVCSHSFPLGTSDPTYFCDASGTTDRPSPRIVPGPHRGIRVTQASPQGNATPLQSVKGAYARTSDASRPYESPLEGEMWQKTQPGENL